MSSGAGHLASISCVDAQAIVSRQRLIARRDGGVALGKRRSKPRLQFGDIGWRLIGALVDADADSGRLWDEESTA